MLDELAGELLLQAAELLGAVDLLALARASRACRAAADDARVWRGLLARQLAPVLRVYFDGAPPPPGGGRTWKQHYFEFYWGWKRRAQARSGRLLVQIAAPPPPSAGWWRRGTEERGPATCGVYDVTAFAAQHPGPHLIEEAAALVDATEYFEMADHSEAAARRLKTLVVPGLEALRYARDVEALRRARLGVCPAALAVLVCAAPVGTIMACVEWPGSLMALPVFVGTALCVTNWRSPPHGRSAGGKPAARPTSWAWHDT